MFMSKWYLNKLQWCFALKFYDDVVNMARTPRQWVIIQLWHEHESRIAGDSAILEWDLAEEAARHLIAVPISAYSRLRTHSHATRPIG